MQSYLSAYTYDGAGRLVSETDGVSGDTYTYTLTDAGKRTALDLTPFGAGPNPTIAIAYDGDVVDTVDGNALIYDDWLGVTTNHDGTTIARDARGAVQQTTASGITVRYLRDASGLPVAREENGTLRITHWHPLDPGRRPRRRGAAQRRRPRVRAPGPPVPSG